MKSIFKKIIVFTALQLVCVFAFSGCGGSAVMDTLKRYGIDTKLLGGYQIVYEVKGETFTGRAPSYGILSFKNEPTAFLQSFSTDKSYGFSPEKNEELENAVVDDLNSHTCWEILQEYYPNWESEYMWFVSGVLNDSDTLYLVYFPNDFKLIVFETGH